MMMEQFKQTFPFKLYNTIEWASNSEHSSALSWSPTGHAFVVHNRDAMVEHIIPKFFDHKKWRSFTRQLNLWGFKRELRGPDSIGETYYHQHFKRGQLDDLHLIQRTEIKKSQGKKSRVPSSHQSAALALAANHNQGFIQGAINPQPQQEAGDIKQGASFLTGLRGAPEVLQAHLATGGGLPTVNYHGSVQPYIRAPLPSTIIQDAASMQPHMMHPHMQGYNWHMNQFNREFLSKLPTQQLVAMASNINGMGMSGFDMLQPPVGVRAVSGSESNARLAMATPSKLDTTNKS